MDQIDMSPTNSKTPGSSDVFSESGKASESLDVSPGSGKASESPDVSPGCEKDSESRDMTSGSNKASGSPDVSPRKVSGSPDMFSADGKASRDSGVFSESNKASGSPDVSPRKVSGSPDMFSGGGKASRGSGMFSESRRVSGSPDMFSGGGKASRGSGMFSESRRVSGSPDMFSGGGKASRGSGMFSESRRVSASPDVSPGYNNSTENPDMPPKYRKYSARYSVSSVGSNSPISPDTSSVSTDTPATPVSILSRTIKQSRKVFIGTYLERRYVKSIQAYRDVIVVDKDEQELIKCLNEVREVVEKQYGTDKWLGLTYDMKDSVIQKYSLWVELERVPLGRHWFQLRSIKVQGHAVQLQLKYLRMFQATERKSLDVIEYPSIDYRELFTYENVCGALKFSAVLVMSVLTLLCHALWYLGDYSIKLTHELSGLIRALTPFGFAIMNFFSKCVGGFYWLLYMLWRGNSMPTYQYQPEIKNYPKRRLPIGYNNY